MNRLLIACLLFSCLESYGQQTYTSANVHSHNDYEQLFPFWAAWRQGFGSIEADVFLDNGELIVAHERTQMKRRWTIDSLYLQPLQQCIRENKGYVFADTSRQLQLLIDIKSEAVSTLNRLVEKLRDYPLLTATSSLKIVISGNRPEASGLASYPDWIWFDGDLQKEYNKDQLDRIEMLSGNFSRYSSWNGKGRLPEKERLVLKELISNAHSLNKKIRFWNSPDIMNSWYSFMELGIDYINTDHIDGITTFLRQLPDRIYSAAQTYEPYRPIWRNDGLDKTVRNVILLIGDGTGLAQWYAGYTANKGALNVFSMRHTGISKTSSFDNYITDSAPGATAISAGIKTNNRAVGVDHAGNRLLLLPEIVSKRSMKTVIITSGDLRDATPASFYAHQTERSNYKAVLTDLLTAPIDIIMGACDLNPGDSTMTQLSSRFAVYSSIDSIKISNRKPLFIAEHKAGLPVSAGRGDWAQKAFGTATTILSQHKEGFLLVLEGAQIDHGGHANKLAYAVTELLDFDRVIGEAMKFADGNGETLVIVTGDHETGGLTLTGGDYSRGIIHGQFSTEDHTAIPVPVFAYGPQSQLFEGIYENTAIFSRILQALKIQ